MVKQEVSLITTLKGDPFVFWDKQKKNTKRKTKGRSKKK